MGHRAFLSCPRHPLDGRRTTDVYGDEHLQPARRPRPPLDRSGGSPVSFRRHRHRPDRPGAGKSPPHHQPDLYLAAQYTVASLCFFYSITSPRISLGDAITLGATAPIFVALLSVPLLGEKVARHVILAVILAFAGVIGVVQPTFHSSADVALIATLGALGYAFAMIWLRKMGSNENSEGVALHFSVVAAAANLLLAIPVWKMPDSRGLLWLVGTGITGGIGQVVMTKAFALTRAAPLSVLGYLSIIFTYLLAIPIFGERAGAIQVGGAVMVIAAGLILAYDAWKQPGGPGLVAVADVIAKD